MQGTVDAFDRPLATVELRAPGGPLFHPVSAWIDTGFTGHLVLPRDVVSLLGLPRIGRLRAKLADGREHSLDTFSAEANWLAAVNAVEVIQTTGDSALLGLCMLRGTHLQIDFASRELTIDRATTEP